MSVLGLYYEALDERRAMEDIEDASWEAGDLFAKMLDGMDADELAEPDLLHDLAGNARWTAAVRHGVEYDDMPGEEALIADADIPARIAAAPCRHCGRRAA